MRCLADVLSKDDTLFTSDVFGIRSCSLTFQPPKTTNMAKVTGIGGIFFKCKDTQQVKDWYQKHLGLPVDDYGAGFRWFEDKEGQREGFTQWSPFKESTTYFEPSPKEFMINYRVDNLEALVEELKKDGVTILDQIAAYDYGKFVHILDVEGNKIELWEPVLDDNKL
jgi:predicted enzyme related to lactoylglutathione lyase